MAPHFFFIFLRLTDLSKNASFLKEKRCETTAVWSDDNETSQYQMKFAKTETHFFCICTFTIFINRLNWPM